MHNNSADKIEHVRKKKESDKKLRKFIIVYMNTQEENYVDTVKGDDGSILYWGHSNFRKDEPIQTFYDAYSKYRVI